MVVRVKSYPTGAPAAACARIYPVGHSGTSLSLSSSPFVLDISQLYDQLGNIYYTPGYSYTLKLSGSNFRGFLIQARSSVSGTPLGKFSVGGDGSQQLSQCSPPDSAVTHTSNSVKNSASLTWTAPAAGSGPIVFLYAVVVQNSAGLSTFYATLNTSIIPEGLATDYFGFTTLYYGSIYTYSFPYFLNSLSDYILTDQIYYIPQPSVSTFQFNLRALPYIDYTNVGVTIIGFDGPTCSNDINYCTPTTCLNGGTCYDGYGTYTNCTCAPGFNGTTCSNDINYCTPTTCLNGSTCVEGYGTATSCKNVESNIYTTALLPVSSPVPTSNGDLTVSSGVGVIVGVVLGVILGTLLVTAIIIVGVYLGYIRSNRAMKYEVNFQTNGNTLKITSSNADDISGADIDRDSSVCISLKNEDKTQMI
eukprot:Em0018g240a